MCAPAFGMVVLTVGAAQLHLECGVDHTMLAQVLARLRP